MHDWRTILLKATLATGLSVAASLIVAATVVPAIGGVVDGNAWLMCVVCPLFVAFPASAWQFWQAARLRSAHSEIARLHERLAGSHRELQAAHAELAARARRDGMTGLLNREAFLAALPGAMARAGQGVLLVIDADHFKAINDRFGHPVGDAALLAIAEAVRASLGAGGVCGRIGGEEFAAYIACLDHAEAQRIAEGIRQAVSDIDFTVERGGGLPLSVSIGGALHRHGARTADLLAEADRHLYRAKSLGRNRVVLAQPAKTAA